jgi:hypothetical protein
MTIQALRNRDKMKDDAIAQLSDYALTARCMRLKNVAIVPDMTQ